jgi:hypothetical protein
MYVLKYPKVGRTWNFQSYSHALLACEDVWKFPHSISIIADRDWSKTKPTGPPKVGSQEKTIVALTGRCINKKLDLNEHE